MIRFFAFALIEQQQTSPGESAGVIAPNRRPGFAIPKRTVAPDGAKPIGPTYGLDIYLAPSGHSRVVAAFPRATLYGYRRDAPPWADMSKPVGLPAKRLLQATDFNSVTCHQDFKMSRRMISIRRFLQCTFIFAFLLIAVGISQSTLLAQQGVDGNPRGAPKIRPMQYASSQSASTIISQQFNAIVSSDQLSNSVIFTALLSDQEAIEKLLAELDDLAHQEQRRKAKSEEAAHIPGLIGLPGESHEGNFIPKILVAGDYAYYRFGSHGPFKPIDIGRLPPSIQNHGVVYLFIMNDVPKESVDHVLHEIRVRGAEIKVKISVPDKYDLSLFSIYFNSEDGKPLSKIKIQDASHDSAAWTGKSYGFVDPDTKQWMEPELLKNEILNTFRGRVGVETTDSKNTLNVLAQHHTHTEIAEALRQKTKSNEPPSTIPVPRLSAQQLREIFSNFEVKAYEIAKQVRGMKPGENRFDQQNELLKQAVADAFDARQELEQAELHELRARMTKIEETTAARTRKRDEIIERRLKVLLEPSLNWKPDADGTSLSTANVSSFSVLAIPIDSKADQPDWIARPTKPTAKSERIPLNNLVQRFNKSLTANKYGIDQHPVTDDEIIASIRWTMEAQKSNSTISQAFLSRLAAIADSRLLPEHSECWITIDNGGRDIDGIHISTRNLMVYFKDEQQDQYRGFTFRKQFSRDDISQQEFDANAAIHKGFKSSTSDGKPLRTAIDEFNAQHQSLAGQSQPALTEGEVIRSILAWTEHRMDAPVTNSEFNEFQKIARTRNLPKGTELELVTSFFPDNEYKFAIWSIRIRTPRMNKSDGTYSYVIRETHVRTWELRKSHRDIVWGQPAKNGLQVGLQWEPAYDRYATGQKVRPKISIRNNSVSSLSVTIPDFLTNDDYKSSIEAIDNVGALIAIDQARNSGVLEARVVEFGPGQMIALDGMPITLGDAPRRNEAETIIRAKPGQQADVSFRLPNYHDKDDEQLKTGAIRFEME